MTFRELLSKYLLALLAFVQVFPYKESDLTSMLLAAAERGKVFTGNRARIKTRFPVLEDIRAALPDRQDVPRSKLEDLSFATAQCLMSLEIVPRQHFRLAQLS